MTYTACYTKTDSGYMGQLLEWPEVVSEGNTIEECRAMLIDAVKEMAIVYLEDNLHIPSSHILFEQLSLNIPEVKMPSYVN